MGKTRSNKGICYRSGSGAMLPPNEQRKAMQAIPSWSSTWMWKDSLHWHQPTSGVPFWTVRANGRGRNSPATYRRVKGNNSDSVVHQPNSKEPGALLPRGNIGQAHANNIGRHLLSLCVLIQLSWLRKRNTRDLSTNAANQHKNLSLHTSFFFFSKIVLWIVLQPFL